MEPFLDFGLFEMLIFIAFAGIINFIHLRKYLLIAYSTFALTAPIVLFFAKNKILFDCLVSFCVFNSIIYVILLWQHKYKDEGEKLIDLEKLKSIISSRKEEP